MNRYTRDLRIKAEDTWHQLRGHEHRDRAEQLDRDLANLEKAIHQADGRRVVAGKVCSMEDYDLNDVWFYDCQVHPRSTSMVISGESQIMGGHFTDAAITFTGARGGLVKDVRIDNPAHGSDSYDAFDLDGQE